MTDLAKAMATTAEAVDTLVAELIPENDGPLARLHRAARYAMLGGGKRLRPFLVVESAGLFDRTHSNRGRAGALRVAAAIELVHGYSLVHDDLPAMDDDDLRRGRPTTHIEFDEATAILVGDGLLTLAFEVLAGEATDTDPAVRCALVTRLARAAGLCGMVGGQAMDLDAEHRRLDLDEITALQRLKTGALIAFSCEAGAVLGCASTEARRALGDYARAIGLAFQIADDLLDIEGDAAQVGKGVGKDADAGKATFASLLGVEGARTEARRLVDSARRALEPFDARADRLRAVAAFIVDRDH